MLNQKSALFTLLTAALVLEGCSYYTDKIRQENLTAQLANRYQFQQQAGTFLMPPTYIVCGDLNYPCRIATPLYFPLPKPKNTLHSKIMHKKVTHSNKTHVVHTQRPIVCKAST